MRQKGVAPPRSSAQLSISLVGVFLTVYCIGVVTLFASGRMDVTLAISFLGVPVVVVLALVRPEWMILAIVIVPPQLISQIPPMRLLAVMLVTLFGFFVQGRLHLGLETGLYPLLGIIVLALTVKAEVASDAALAADTMLKLIAFYTLLMLAGFHAVVRRRINIDTFLNALLIGLVFGALLEPFVTSQAFESIMHHPFRSHFAYLAVMGFGVTYVRLSLKHSAGESRSPLEMVLMFAFLVLTVISYSRATWMAGLVVFALVSLWTGRKSFWIVLVLFVLLALSVPLVGERILPSGSVDTDPDTLALVTTGRSVLWGKLWSQGSDALPFGNGWGFVESLSSTDLFGIEGEFSSGESPFVYPHNDFVYLYVQFGIVGLGLLVVYWADLLRTIRILGRSRSEATRYSVRLLIPIISVMLFVQLFDNGLAIVAVAARFFIAAGLVFGLLCAARETGPAETESTGSAIAA